MSLTKVSNSMIAGATFSLSDYGSDLATAITNIGSTSGTLTINAATTISSNLTVPATLELVFQKNALITIGGSSVLTINGPITAGTYQIFNSPAANQVIITSSTGKVFAAWFGFSSSQTAAVNKQAIGLAVYAVSAVFATGTNGGEVILHKGTFSVDGDLNVLTTGVVITGASDAIGYDGAVYPGTIINFVTGTSGFVMGSVASPSRNNVIKNMKIYGSNVLTNGIWLSGTVQVENIVVTNCVNGIRFGYLCNQSNLKNVTCAYNSVYGALSDDPSNTVIDASFCNFRENGVYSGSPTPTVGVGFGILAGVGVSLYRCVIESNYGVGLYIYNQDVPSNELHSFYKCWFEANDRNSTTKFQVLITSYNVNTAEPNGMHFVDCLFDPNQTYSCSVVAGADHRFDHCYGGIINVSAGVHNCTTSYDINGPVMNNLGNSSNYAGNQIATYANNAAAIAGGLVAGQVYQQSASVDPQPLFVVR